MVDLWNITGSVKIEILPTSFETEPSDFSDVLEYGTCEKKKS